MKSIEKRTGITPKAILNKPAISEDGFYYLEAFYILRYSATDGGIPLSEVLLYCDHFGILESESHEFIKIIYKIYDIASEIDRERIEKERKKKPASIGEKNVNRK